MQIQLTVLIDLPGRPSEETEEGVALEIQKVIDNNTGYGSLVTVATREGVGGYGEIQ